MKKLFKNKAIISVSVVFIVVALIASIFIDVSFAGTPLESKNMLYVISISNGYISSSIRYENPPSASEVSELEKITWPERRPDYMCNDNPYFLSTEGYIVRYYSDGIDVYDRKSGEIKEIWSASHIQTSILITDKELCFSAWEVDIGNWPVIGGKQGTYKYSFETGELEKISNRTYWDLSIKNNHILFGENLFGIPKIIFIF